MAEESEDPREGPQHPRFTKALFGHEAETHQFLRAFHAGKLHHAWLLTGAKGIGKASFAYKAASYVLNGEGRPKDTVLDISPDAKTAHWIAAGAHPDVFILERQLNDSKPRRLKSEISVNDARKLTDFFGRTAGGNGWRVAIVDAADDLNTESANALLKLVEEPPRNCLLLLVCHSPGILIRTMRSRCTRLPFSGLTETEVLAVLTAHRLESEPINRAAMDQAIGLANGSPGRAQMLLNSSGAVAFTAYRAMNKLSAPNLVEFTNRFVGRTLTTDDFNVFCDLLLDWVGNSARNYASNQPGRALAQAHAQISHSIRRTNALNLDRRQAVIDAVKLIDDAMRAA